MRGSENGVCPHCGRADAVKATHPKPDGEVPNERRRFECGGCKAVWMGVRRQVATYRRMMR